MCSACFCVKFLVWVAEAVDKAKYPTSSKESLTDWDRLEAQVRKKYALYNLFSYLLVVGACIAAH
jgi:hypothetical protein